MPPYPGTAGSFVPAPTNASPIALQRGESVFVLGQLAASATQLPVTDTNVTFEAAPAGATVASIACNLQCTSEGGTAPGIYVEVHCNGAPGAAESIAIQEADTDADGFYITPSNAAYTISSFNANNAARSDLIPTGGKFVRVLRTKGANAVGITVKISRAA
jgi:hypothetical protein